MSNLRKLHEAYVIWLDIDVSWPVEGSLRPDLAEQGFQLREGEVGEVRRTGTGPLENVFIMTPLKCILKQQTKCLITNFQCYFHLTDADKHLLSSF